MGRGRDVLHGETSTWVSHQGLSAQTGSSFAVGMAGELVCLAAGLAALTAVAAVMKLGVAHHKL